MNVRQNSLCVTLAWLAMAPLAACGFKPVYMPTASGGAGPAERNLQAIHVDLIPERTGQMLRQELQRRMYGAGESVSPRYDLQVRYWLTGEGIGILPDTTSTRTRLTAHAVWTLVDRAPPHKQVAAGTASAVGGVNFLDTQYFSAELNTQQLFAEFAREVADQITLRLATMFRQQAG